jgi:hypothetical protein
MGQILEEKKIPLLDQEGNFVRENFVLETRLHPFRIRQEQRDSDGESDYPHDGRKEYSFGFLLSDFDRADIHNLLASHVAKALIPHSQDAEDYQD